MDDTQIDVDAYTVAEFCIRNRVSRSKFYELRKVGLAPLIFYVDTKPLISREAAAEWRRSMTERSKQQAA